MGLLGRALLLLALATAAYAVITAIGSMRPGRRTWLRSAETGVFAVFGLTSAAMVTMFAALLTNDYSLKNVADYTSETLPIYFKFSSLWASQAGSLLLWTWLLSLFAAIAVYTNRARNRELMPVVIGVLMAIAVFFTGLISFIASPFESLSPAATAGRGLNPLLQNPYMVAHPPMLYIGYVSLSVPFAFAMAALVTRRLDTVWITSVRRWTIMSWLFLGIGILLGSRWAYHELGWGGYWAWDPVENAALMPWLVATAFLHSVMVQERRGMLKVWNILLVIMTFSLAIFGTFLTRSGIVISVHAFGESTVGPIFLGFLVVLLVGSLGLLVTRLPLLRSEHSLESFLSREAVFLFNNVLLVGLTFAVFWGTMFPVLSQAIRDRKQTVGQGFFDQVSMPIGIALLVLTGVGPLIPWRKASAAQLRRRFAIPLVVAAATGLALALLSDAWNNFWAAVVFMAGGFVVACISGEFWRGTKVRHALGGVSWPAAGVQLVARNRRRYGGYLVHLGIVVLFVGFAGSKGFASEGDFIMRQGDRATVAGYTVVYESAARGRTANKTTVAVQMGLFQDGRRIGTMRPGRNFYPASQQPSTEVAIDTTLGRDVYLVLGALDESGQARISMFVNPLVAWLWVAGLIVFLGGLIAAWPASRRRPQAPIRAEEEQRPAVPA
jgi:cytochrome c-type biogenesis protein CcmF